MIETFNKFDTISYVPLRTFNRAVYFSNLMQDRGKEVATEYVNLFNEGERKAMGLILMAIKKLGYKTVVKQVTDGVEFPYDPELDD